MLLNAGQLLVVLWWILCVISIVTEMMRYTNKVIFMLVVKIMFVINKIICEGHHLFLNIFLFQK